MNGDTPNTARHILGQFTWFGAGLRGAWNDAKKFHPGEVILSRRTNVEQYRTRPGIEHDGADREVQ